MATMIPRTTPTAIEAKLTDRVTASAFRMKGQFASSTCNSFVMTDGKRAKPARAGPAMCCSPLFLEDLEFLVGGFVLELVVDGGQPVQELGLVLVDGHADIGWHLAVLQALIALREDGEAFHFLAEVDPGDGIDRREIGAARHDLVRRRIG